MRPRRRPRHRTWMLIRSHAGLPLPRETVRATACPHHKPGARPSTPSPHPARGRTRRRRTTSARCRERLSRAPMHRTRPPSPGTSRLGATVASSHTWAAALPPGSSPGSSRCGSCRAKVSSGEAHGGSAATSSASLPRITWRSCHAAAVAYWRNRRSWTRTVCAAPRLPAATGTTRSSANAHTRGARSPSSVLTVPGAGPVRRSAPPPAGSARHRLVLARVIRCGGRTAGSGRPARSGGTDDSGGTAGRRSVDASRQKPRRRSCRGLRCQSFATLTRRSR